MHQARHTVSHINRVLSSFTFFLAIALLGALLASNGLSSQWIPQQVLVFFGWILLVCVAIGMVLFVLEKE
jgi:hypothetical protein